MLSKRYTDTEKWKKRWFRELSTAEKSAWFYITEQCDNVGVWDADFSAAEFMIGEKIDWQGFIERTNGNIEVLDCGKWWLSDFCSFQYTDLSPESKSIPVISHIKLLKKHGLYEKVMEMLKPLANLDVSLVKDLKAKTKEKAKVKVKVKAKEKEKAKEAFTKEVLEYYAQLTEKTKMTKVPVEVGARYEEGFTLEDAKKVIKYKYLKWWNDPKTKTWVNLTTLFRPSHFGEYLSQAEQELTHMQQEAYNKYKQDILKQYQDTGEKQEIVPFEEWCNGEGEVSQISAYS